MNAPKRSRARVLTPEGLQKLREQVRSHEVEENAGFKYTLERLGELTGLDPETVKNVLDCKGSDKRTIARCFETFGLTLAESDHIPAAQATTTADPNFVGRDEAIADLDTLVSRNARVIVMQARGGVGKTTLARKYLQQEFGSFLEFPIAKETKDIASIEGLLEEKLRQLGEEPGREFLVSLDRLKRKLQTERIGILIDNLEPALDSAGKFIEAHRRYVELLRVLSDLTVQSITLITSRERLREADVTVQHYSLRSLDVQAWEQFFQSRSINTDIPSLATLHDAYGGNAKAMDIISGAVLEDFSGNVEAYWQANQDDLFIERDLEDLVTKQFDRLQELDPDAYKLLYRMGCYRYQDVPTVPIEGLFCLLWDIPENRQKRVIKALQDRSLADCEDREFWLHPVIRTEAITRLRASEDWEVTNRKTASFWTVLIDMVRTLEEAFRAFESYYHYLNINDFEMCAEVIVKARLNQWREGEHLGNSFYRLGLHQQVNIAINRILVHLKPSYSLGKCLNLLGLSFQFLGQTHKAIECYVKSSEVAQTAFNLSVDESLETIKFKLRRLITRSLHHIGLCKIDLWELEEAMSLFKQILTLLEEKKACELGLFEHESEELHGIALTSSYLGLMEEAFEYASLTNGALDRTGLAGWHKGEVAVLLGLTYKNLGDFEKAYKMYCKAILFDKEYGHILIKARALSGLAVLYREQNNFQEALFNHGQSISILKQIGAKCSLADAYYEFGSTYLTIKQIDKSNESFQEAIRLFSEMKAPKQVERVRQSMQNKKGRMNACH
ncbi:MAG: tetratricopeptide repeat protein [Lyngbya sp. HA4199-MV5]|jgi:tetratricopeptide (TPR) repeat protein|nr:tetratricopeptide repeat protein [Lyngbya sp. HA4199-MV5]